MSSGIFRISLSTVPAFFRRSSSFSLSSAQLVIASNNALIAQTNMLFFMTISYNRYSCGNLCFGWRVSCDIISLEDALQHRATKVGTRFESTAFAGLAVPGPQSGFKGIAHTTNIPGTMFGVVSGMASLSNYVWLGSTYTKFYEHNGDKRPDVFNYSLVYGYRPPKWRRPPDKWDWRLFGELVGERSDRFLVSNAPVANTQASQVFLGPTALGIFHNYTVSFGAQFPIYQDVGTAFPKERVRFAVNFSYLLFQHSH